MRGSEKSIKAVAYGMGFCDAKSLTRRFKRHLAVKPSDLRRTSPSDALEKSDSSKKIFPMNVHLLPSQTRPLCFEQYFPESKRVAGVLSEHDAIMDKLRHPGKYV